MTDKEKIEAIREFVLQLEEEAHNYDDSLHYLTRVEDFIDKIIEQ